jgi:Ice-binding-like
MITLKNLPVFQEHTLRFERLVYNFDIIGNATPANKTQDSDLPGMAVLRMQGQTAQADAIESDIMWTTPVDNSSGNSVFGILLFLDGNEAEKVYDVNITQVNFTPSTPAAPLLGVAATYAVLGASAVTNSGSSVLTGNLGIYPNNSSSVTGFPPGTVTGAVNEGNAAAAAAQAAALSAYNTMRAMPATAIPAILDGQTLTPGVYTESSGTFNLAASGNGTLTLNGAGTYIFNAASTLVTGAGGTPTITLTGGATAANVYWTTGSSATINSGHTGTFQGSIIADVSITNTSGGTVNGTLAALTGAVTMSAAANSNAPVNPPNPVLSITGPNLGTSLVTPQGNIAIEVAATGLSLAAAATSTFLVQIEYLERRDNYFVYPPGSNMEPLNN